MAIEIVSFPIKNGDFHQRVFFFTILIAWNESNQLTLVSSIMATIWVSFHHLSTWVQRRKDKGGAFLKWWYPNKAGWFGKSDFLFHGWLFGAPPRLRKTSIWFRVKWPFTRASTCTYQQHSHRRFASSLVWRWAAMWSRPAWLRFQA